ncbi:MAG: CBS domain-containing protein [Pseudomonadota bacterium]
MRIKDRPEYSSKPRVLTMAPDTPLREAVREMCKRRYGSVVVTDPEGRMLGIFTERDALTRVIDEGRDLENTRLEDVMTTDVRTASAEDNLIDWLRIMSNERFRRLPIVDEQGRVISMMTQGDFVSYTWPELLGQLSLSARAAVGKHFSAGMVALSVALYTVVLIAIIAALY